MLDNIRNGHLIWDILNEDEKIALSLNIIEGKSSWQAGEIMGKSHYKYLEIFNRAKEFLRIFSRYFEKYDTLKPKFLNVPTELQDYFEELITQRKRIMQVSKSLPGNYRMASYRNAKIIEVVKKLANSPYEVEQEWLNMILSFDKWNNYRILPKEVQEPHAFKRRNKNRYKHRIKLFNNIPQYAKDRLIRILEKEKTRKHKKPGRLIYFHLIDEVGEAHMYCLNETPPLVELLNGLYIYFFESEEIATEYINHIQTKNPKGNCRDGLKFWPRYRALIRMSLNYDAQQSIIPSRKYYDLLERDNLELNELFKLRENTRKKGDSE